jgi:predicted small lipoprotein YifL
MKNKISLLLVALLALTLMYCGSKKAETTTEDYGTPDERQHLLKRLM